MREGNFPVDWKLSEEAADVVRQDQMGPGGGGVSGFERISTNYLQLSLKICHKSPAPLFLLGLLLFFLPRPTSFHLYSLFSGIWENEHGI